LKPVVEARGGVKDVRAFERSPSGLFLLPGDIKLSDFEAELTGFWGDCMQRKVKGFNGTSSLSMVVNNCVMREEVDYVFYDTGPNIGPLNRIILLDCDYFIVPGACDLFSVRALNTLGHTLVSWILDWQTITALAPDETFLLPGQPQFLGYIPQNFRIYGQAMARQPAQYLARFEKRLYSDVITRLRQFEKKGPGSGRSIAKLGEVKDFATLVQHAQEQGVALWKVKGGNTALKSDARSVFSKIAGAIIERTMRK